MHALHVERVAPKALFDWTMRQRGADLFRTTRLSLWDDYAEQGDFPPQTKAALLSRAVTQRP